MSNVHEKHETIISTPTDLTIRIEREFDAPREFIWKANTDRELMARWLGPKDTPMVIPHQDVRIGGTYRWETVGREDNIHFWGEFLEVEEPSVLAMTFNVSGIVCAPAVDRLELFELEGGRTKLVATETFTTKEARDGKLQSGMERGVNDGYDALDEIIRESNVGETA